jgi:hypothetical protein
MASETDAPAGLTDVLHRMGHGLFQYPTPDGYPDQELPWMGTLMWRWNFALALANNNQPGVRTGIAQLLKALGFGRILKIEKLFGHLVGRMPSATELEALEMAQPDSRNVLDSKQFEERSALVAGLILASPAFQRC